MEFPELKEVGLSEGEIKVYSALVSIGPSSLIGIQEKTSIERRNIYDILNKLIGKGLVSYTTQDKIRVFQCAPPKNLMEKIISKEKKLDELKKKIPQISSLYESSKPQIRAEVFRGKGGIRAIFEDTLNCKEVYFIGGGHYVIDFLPKYWLSYNLRRIKSKIKWINLWRYELRNEATPLKLEKIKVLPKEFSGNPNVIFIYGNKIANVLWGENPFAFVIESSEIADNYKKYHNYLWNHVAFELSKQ